MPGHLTLGEALNGPPLQHHCHAPLSRRFSDMQYAELATSWATHRNKGVYFYRDAFSHPYRRNMVISMWSNKQLLRRLAAYPDRLVQTVGTATGSDVVQVRRYRIWYAMRTAALSPCLPTRGVRGERLTARFWLPHV